MNRLSHLLTAFLLWPAIAIGQVPADSAGASALPDVMITGTRLPVPQRRLPQLAIVVSDSLLQRLPAADLTEALRRTAAVDIIQYPGVLAGVGIRGFRPQFSGINQRTLLLVNGRWAGTTNIATLNPLLLARVEVLKGPYSAEFGAQAMGGVVNLVYPVTTGPVRGSILAEYGSFSSYRLGTVVGGTIGSTPLDFDLSVQFQDRNEDFQAGRQTWIRDWLNFTHVRVEPPNAPAESRPDDRGDGSRRPYSRYQTWTGYARLGWRLAEGWRVDASGDFFTASDILATGDILSPTSANQKDLSRGSTELRLTGRAGRHDITGLGFYGWERADNEDLFAGTTLLTTPFRSFASRPAWYGWQVRDQVTLGQHQVVMGVDYNHAVNRSERFSATGGGLPPFSPNAETGSLAAYLQGELRLWQERLTVRPGIRLERIRFQTEATRLATSNSEAFAGTGITWFVSPSLGVVAQVAPGLDVVVNSGRAFVNPDAFQVAGRSERRITTGNINQRGYVITTGNPDLRPESSWGYEGGLRYRRTQWQLQVVYYQNDVADRITTVTTVPTGELFNGEPVRSRVTYANANTATIRGLDYLARYQTTSRGTIRRWGADLQMSQLLEAQEAIAATGRETPVRNVAWWNATFRVDAELATQTGVLLALRYIGERYDTDFTDARSPQITYAPYAAVDLSISQPVPVQWANLRATLLVSNLTDENYYEKYGFPLPGRSVAVRLQWNVGQM